MILKEQLMERVFPVTDRRLPLDRAPVTQLPEWGHWLETPDLIAAVLPPGQLEVNLSAPFEFISTRFQPGYGMAAFDSDKLVPYHSEPGGFDVVPQGSTYRSKETTGFCIILAYEQANLFQKGFAKLPEIIAEYTDATPIELIPGQVPASTKGTHLAQALQAFFTDPEHVGGTLYLESLATLIMGYVIRHHSNLSKRLKQVPDCLTPKQLKTIVEYIKSHFHCELRLYQITEQVKLSPYYLAHAFKTTTGLSPHQYVLHCRLEQAQRLLRNMQMPIAAIAYDVGFGSQSHMTTVFQKMLQMTPSLYRKELNRDVHAL
ncbi:MAG: helix-turn-helix transcriptional regulator [Leptolyngbya sp. IPPAS B-1204]|nr:MAG: AraC family transcriptional regulator [Leptolyngbya sp. IPPAS B-1204]